ncbi:CocE/NonD family hydrolase [Cyanobium sp. NS01]|uniref:CocE/NonD family hydrolase n=1 Tax=Cyanobium sp. NS01 TaxID=261284 RepID=UPI00185FAD40|nr:CocE/NonD family hydrolase [Cyanobium sp. NS01]QNI70699.1 X-Pro dipeptidyl-peptidase/ S15 family [Cyanobium sp. NS01]
MVPQAEGSGPPSPQDHWLTCRDGVRLVSRIWEPEGEGPWPVLLMRQPYGRAIASTVTYAHPSWYASHGFLVVVQDVRGRGDSEGDFAGFAQEARDGTDTLRWARQLPGSNGRLGCYGFSYQGLAQLLLDADGPLPDCLAPAMAGLDERLHWASSGGAHWWALGLGWGLQLAAERLRRRGDSQGWLEIRGALDSGQFLSTGPELMQRHDPGGMALRWLRSDAGEPTAWSRHSPPDALWRQPMLLIGGWHDPHLSGVLDLWQQARRRGGQPLLRLGAWSHLRWDGGLDGLQLRFFRHHLQDAPLEPTGTPAVEAAQDLAQAVALQDCRGGPWLRGRSEAPGGREQTPGPRSWALGSAGLAAVDPQEGWLAASAPGDGGGGGGGARPRQPVSWVHDPWRPVPGRGGHLGLDAGLCERSDLDRRTDVACFSSTPLEAPELIAGWPRLELQVAADQDGFDLCAALSVLERSGAVRQLCTGVLRQRGPHCRQVRCLTLHLQPLWTRLEPGERLRLSLAGAAWPQLAVNPGTGDQPWGGADSRHRVITYWLATAESRLTIAPFAWTEAGANCGH